MWVYLWRHVHSTAVWGIILLRFASVLFSIHQVFQPLWIQPTSCNTTHAPHPCDSEFRERSSGPSLKPIAFPHQLHKCLVRRHILYWSATCKVHLWPHMGPFKGYIGTRGLWMCFFVFTSVWRASVCLLVYGSQYTCVFEVHDWMCIYHVGIRHNYVCEQACVLWEWKF